MGLKTQESQLSHHCHADDKQCYVTWSILQSKSWSQNSFPSTLSLTQGLHTGKLLMALHRQHTNASRKTKNEEVTVWFKIPFNCVKDISSPSTRSENWYPSVFVATFKSDWGFGFFHYQVPNLRNLLEEDYISESGKELFSQVSVLKGLYIGKWRHLDYFENIDLNQHDFRSARLTSYKREFLKQILAGFE